MSEGALCGLPPAEPLSGVRFGFFSGDISRARADASLEHAPMQMAMMMTIMAVTPADTSSNISWVKPLSPDEREV